MTKKILSLIAIAIVATLASCDNDSGEYYWCPVHHEYHCCHTECDKVKYCHEHCGYYEYPKHWNQQIHHINR